MKRLFSILLVLILFQSSAQIADYFGNNPTWGCGYWEIGQQPGDEFEENFVYYLNGDSTILGEVYHRVYKRGYKNYLLTQNPMDELFDESAGLFVRQVGKSIRFCQNNLGSQNIWDSLLVDYNAQVGDNPIGHIFSGAITQNTIQKIDSILINTEYRKVFFLDTLVGTSFTEGIGHQQSSSSNIGEMFINNWGGIGFDHLINCYGQNLNPLWDVYGNGANCNLAVSINELLPINKKELLKVVDLMGRETEDKPNTPLIYIYSDGTTEKTFRIE